MKAPATITMMATIQLMTAFTHISVEYKVQYTLDWLTTCYRIER